MYQITVVLHDRAKITFLAVHTLPTLLFTMQSLHQVLQVAVIAATAHVRDRCTSRPAFLLMDGGGMGELGKDHARGGGEGGTMVAQKIWRGV